MKKKFHYLISHVIMAILPLYLLGSAVSTSAAAYISYYRFEQFYPVCVNLVTGKVNQMILANFFLSCLVLMGYFVKKITLGKFREVESEELLNKLWNSLFDALLLSTIFSSEISATFFGLLAIQMFFRGFHWVAKSRVDFMEIQPNVSIISYIRLAFLTTLLFFVDFLYVSYVIALSYTYGPSVQILFGFEYCILLWSILLIQIKFLVNAYERITQSPWQSKPGFIRIVEFLEQGMKFITLLIFFGTIQAYYRTPIHLFRRIFLSFRAFQRGLANVQDYYRLVRNLNTLFPDATEEQLRNDPMCLICRQEDMQNGKLLPCGHIFHANCLYGWLTHSHACPTCRFSLRDLGDRNQRGGVQAQNNFQNRRQPQAHPQVPEIPQPQAQGTPPNMRAQQFNNNEDRVEQRRPEEYVSPTPTRNNSNNSTDSNSNYMYKEREPSFSYDTNNNNISNNEEQINILEQNMQLMREQLECLSQIMHDTQEQLTLLRSQMMVPPTIVIPKEEKKEEPEENFTFTNEIETQNNPELEKKEEEPENIPSPKMSPREELRQRRLLRFSSDA